MSAKTSTRSASPFHSLLDMDCNFLHADLEPNIPELIANANTVGVSQFFVPGCTVDESQRTLKLTEAYPGQCLASTGVHPYCVPEESPEESEQWTVLEGLAKSSAALAIGEFGLDSSPGFPPLARQLPWYRAQLDLALQVHKPLFLHERGAFAEFKLELEERGYQPTMGGAADTKSVTESQHSSDLPGALPRGLVHCFTGTTAELQYYVSLDFYIGITGYIFQNKESVQALREALSAGAVPLNRLVIETDAPYMGFKNCRKQTASKRKAKYPNVPSALPLVCTELATLLAVEPHVLAHMTTQNARRFLGLPLDENTPN